MGKGNRNKGLRMSSPRSQNGKENVASTMLRKQLSTHRNHVVRAEFSPSGRPSSLASATQVGWVPQGLPPQLAPASITAQMSGWNAVSHGVHACFHTCKPCWRQQTAMGAAVANPKGPQCDLRAPSFLSHTPLASGLADGLSETLGVAASKAGR